MTAADADRAILAIWRIEQPRLITYLARMLRDVPLAEDLTQEALVAALERWPVTGVPEKPRRVADGDGQTSGLGSCTSWPDARA
jgi:predicted RNA polymerase sigma factor